MWAFYSESPRLHVNSVCETLLASAISLSLSK